MHQSVFSLHAPNPHKIEILFLPSVADELLVNFPQLSTNSTLLYQERCPNSLALPTFLRSAVVLLASMVSLAVKSVTPL